MRRKQGGVLQGARWGGPGITSVGGISQEKGSSAFLTGWRGFLLLVLFERFMTKRTQLWVF